MYTKAKVNERIIIIIVINIKKTNKKIRFLKTRNFF